MKKVLLFLVLLSFFIVSCKKSDHFISNHQYRSMVEQDLNEKMELLGMSNEFDMTLSQLCENDMEREALSFLYAYMPLGDISDYDVSLYIDGIRSAFKAREEMTWGASVPEDIFRHFVLPIRVNNEDLDSARGIFYEELKERVKGLSMYDAVLEVNHWCHEKVIYTPSDIRTSSPLATVRTAYGRCGEESVFTTAALRAVGIPARQVYTPRWAHTDDNHAWVEAWVDGTWYYLGACEPEPKLNVAWFSSTAKRAMLMHTKVFGKYYPIENEDIIQEMDCVTEVNVTSNYAPVEKVTVQIRDEYGDIVENAQVEFKIYNYAEFYSAISKKSDKKGEASGTFGRGDMVVWASEGDRFGFSKIAVGQIEYPAVIVLDRKRGDLFSVDLDITPPVQSPNDVHLTPEEIAANKILLEREDSIRNSYVATFASEKDLDRLLEEVSVKASKRDRDRIFRALTASRGNWRELYRFFTELPQDRFDIGLDLLDVVSEKDLRDSPAHILLDHVLNYNPLYGTKEIKQYPELVSIMKEYLLRPRVGNELLSPWRGFFQKNMTFINSSPEEIISYIKTIKIFDNYNPQNIPQRPIGVYNLGAGDTESRNALFIALCRSMNIPARLEEISRSVQYWSAGEWIDVDFDSDEEAIQSPAKGELNLGYVANRYIEDPRVDSHFTIADLDGLTINSLNFRTVEGFEGTMSYKSRFSKPVELNEGYYMITSGTRMASGKVLVRVSTFNIEAGKDIGADLVMRSDSSDLQVIGSMNPEWKYLRVPIISGTPQLEGVELSESTILDFTGRGFFVFAFVKATHEPSNHLLRSLYGRSWEKPILILYESKAEISLLKGVGLPPVSHGIGVGVDANGYIFKNITRELKLGNVEYPLIIIADSFGRIVYCSEGYGVGTADLLARFLKEL